MGTQCLKKPQHTKTGLPLPRRLRKEKDLRIGTGSIHTLFKGSALKNRIEVFDNYDIDIPAIQEMRWLGHDIMDKKEC
ncbi:hypothetical protein TNCV_4282721 [Trichonephila clavipes]|nr:hypothetical protein TNCV_4282721 [Trichonephila clavipes]